MTSFSTPLYSHLNDQDFNKLYEPAEDTFLMMDALEKDYEIIKERRPLICLEVGPGSGVLITFLATLLPNSAFFLASDINSHAASATKQTGEKNKVDVNVTVDNLISCFQARLKGKIDLLLFNPPYVVTPSEEVGSSSIAASWAGGVEGREVIDRFLAVAVDVLSANGLLYLLLLKQNKPEQIIGLLGQHGFSAEIILERRTGPEYLSVIRFSRSCVT